MDHTSPSSPQMSVSPWPTAYRGRGFVLVERDDGLLQGLVQGGYLTAPCQLPAQVLQLVKELIDSIKEDQ